MASCQRCQNTAKVPWLCHGNLQYAVITSKTRQEVGQPGIIAWLVQNADGSLSSDSRGHQLPVPQMGGDKQHASSLANGHREGLLGSSRVTNRASGGVQPSTQATHHHALQNILAQVAKHLSHAATVDVSAPVEHAGRQVGLGPSTFTASQAPGQHAQPSPQRKRRPVRQRSQDADQTCHQQIDREVLQPLTGMRQAAPR